jgi:PAS domain-containing protein
MGHAGERAARGSDAEARYRALFETMGPAALLMRGPACIDCNPATVAVFGLERREYRAHGFQGVPCKPCRVEEIEQVLAAATAP